MRVEPWSERQERRTKSLISCWSRLELNRLVALSGGRAVLLFVFTTLVEVSYCSKNLLNFQHSLSEFILWKSEFMFSNEMPIWIFISLPSSHCFAKLPYHHTAPPSGLVPARLQQDIWFWSVSLFRCFSCHSSSWSNTGLIASRLINNALLKYSTLPFAHVRYPRWYLF